MKRISKRADDIMLYIYAYQNKINGMVYIGQTDDLKERDHSHTVSGQIAFDRDVLVFGRENFDFWVLTITFGEFPTNQEEIYWIAEMRHQLGREMVYNVYDGGGTGMRGYKHTKETKAKMAIAATGRKHSAETLKKMSDAKKGKPSPNKGKTASEATRQKLSIALSGKIQSPETVAKRVAKLKGQVRTEAQRKTLSEAKKGIPLSEEHKKHLSEVNTGKTLSEETKQKISASHKGLNTWTTGRIRPPEECQEISVRNKKLWAEKNAEKDKSIVDQYNTGKTVQQIASNMCTNATQVYRSLSRHNIVLRPTLTTPVKKGDK